jgi:uncharacterized protein (DUF1697 family)
MPRLFGFLRAINVGGHTVTMDQLRQIFQAAGLKDAETFIASGNVVFSSKVIETGKLEQKIEKALEKALGYEVRTFLRTEGELAAISRYRPFTESARRAAKTLSVGFLNEPLSAANRKALAALRTPKDDFHTQGREIYWLCPDGVGGSLIPNGGMERTLKLRTTFRSMTTVVRLSEKYLSSRAYKV